MTLHQHAYRLAKASLACGLIALSAAAAAQSNPYARGPNPTNASLEATSGPFSYRSFTVSRPSAYGAGTVYYPVNPGGTVGAIAIVPG